MKPMGLILLNKPPGITSFNALFPVKKILGTKKIGHTGTLDQFAQGLILCLVGPFTKLNPFLMELSKTYVAEVYFGKETDTLDPTGTQVSEGRVPSLQEILALVPSFIGDIQQVPPLFSALKIKGKKG
jgi:tRNA pseudouridine55 synthase